MRAVLRARGSSTLASKRSVKICRWQFTVSQRTCRAKSRSGTACPARGRSRS
jgi:hypothetical protein